MRLIVDSGSTKTDWICINEKGEILFDTQTKGLNPQVLTEQIIEERVINNFDLYQNRKKKYHIYISMELDVELNHLESLLKKFLKECL